MEVLNIVLLNIYEGYSPLLFFPPIVLIDINLLIFPG